MIVFDRQREEQIEASARESLRMVPKATRDALADLLFMRFAANDGDQPIYALALYGLRQLERNVAEVDEANAT